MDNATEPVMGGAAVQRLEVSDLIRSPGLPLNGRQTSGSLEATTGGGVGTLEPTNS
jgi:hypothetical protein